ncbi:MAG: heptaprenyl diphosphate synthase [Glaciecola sp.]|jgi:heptaprenyl diphosphate synthase
MTTPRPDSISPTTRLAVPASVVAELESHGLGIGSILDRVEARLSEQVTSSHAFMDEAAKYLMEAGGKRFRPMMVALCGHLGDPAEVRLPDAGVIVELVHLATLYHDDVIDEAPARRGTPSANARWDNTVAILTGDYLFARASELSADLGVEVTRIMAQTIATLCEGQIREVQGSRGALPPDVPRLEATMEHYLGVVGDKTAVLIAASCELGALLAGCTPEQVVAARNYGWNVGMAFQLSDDILDMASEHEQSGKTPGTDLREGVATLPVLFGVEADQTGELSRIVNADEIDDAGVATALDLIRSGDALQRSRAAAHEYVTLAAADLVMFSSPEHATIVKALTKLAEYAVDRVG